MLTLRVAEEFKSSKVQEFKSSGATDCLDFHDLS